MFSADRKIVLQIHKNDGIRGIGKRDGNILRSVD